MSAPDGPRQIPAAHRSSASEIDAWRGRCVRHYSRLEQAIAGFVAERDPKAVAPGHGLGCRIRQLNGLASTSPESGKKLLKRLEQFEDTKHRRAAIVHGDGSIYVDADGRWLWDAHFFPLSVAEPVSEVFRMPMPKPSSAS